MSSNYDDPEQTAEYIALAHVDSPEEAYAYGFAVLGHLRQRLAEAHAATAERAAKMAALLGGVTPAPRAKAERKTAAPDGLTLTDEQVALAVRAHLTAGPASRKTMRDSIQGATDTQIKAALEALAAAGAAKIGQHKQWRLVDAPLPGQLAWGTP